MPRIVRALACIAAALLICAGAQQARADYPSRPITFVVPWPAGAPTDTVPRVYAEYLKEILGQPVIVDNRPGLAGSLGSQLVHRAPPDGYTIGLAVPSSHALIPAGRDTPYVLGKDYTPIGMLTEDPLALVIRSGIPAQNLAEFVAHVKANPDKLNYGSSGAGSAIQLYALVFQKLAGINGMMVHIPYRGETNTIAGMLTGSVDFLVASGAKPQVEAGFLRALATTGDKRWSAMPHLPTLKELGYDYPGSLSLWLAVVGPAGMPNEVVAKLSDALRKASANPNLLRRLVEMERTVQFLTPEELETHIRREQDRLLGVMKENSLGTTLAR